MTLILIIRDQIKRCEDTVYTSFRMFWTSIIRTLSFHLLKCRVLFSTFTFFFFLYIIIWKLVNPISSTTLLKFPQSYKNVNIYWKTTKIYENFFWSRNAFKSPGNNMVRKTQSTFHVLCVVFKYWLGSQQKAGVE